MLLFSLIFTTLLATFAHAQTRQQIESCGGSIALTSFQANPSYDVTDDSHYFNATYTYNSTACTSPSRVRVNRIFLTDQINFQIYVCPLKQFDPTGVLYSQCTRTLGQMARDVRDAQDLDPNREGDYSISISFGTSPTVYGIDNYFFITPVTPAAQPAPSGQRRRSLSQRGFKCEIGQQYCQTDAKTFGCVDTATNLSSCGACPMDENAQDCTAIEGVDHVVCAHSRCIVHSCLRGFQVSSDRRGCIAHRHRRR